MTQKMKAILGIAALVLLLAGAAFAYQALTKNALPGYNLATQPGQVEAPQPSGGEDRAAETEVFMAPDFTVEDAQGETVALSDLRGKPVVLNFWASWCPPCRGEMPEFHTVYEELGAEVHFMMVNLTDGRRETVEAAGDYIAQEGFSFPLYFDTTGEAAQTYEVYSIPTTFFIDADGVFVTYAQGRLDEETLRYGIGLLTGAAAG